MAEKAYDKTKDIELINVTAFRTENMELHVQVFQYDGGQKKIQISRLRKDKHIRELMFAKLGRFTLEEFVAVAQTVKDLKTRGVL